MSTPLKSRENGDTPQKARSPVPAIPSQRQVADYLSDMTGQLARMAQDAKLETLAYLLDMARNEADLARSRRPLLRSSEREEDTV